MISLSAMAQLIVKDDPPSAGTPPKGPPESPSGGPPTNDPPEFGPGGQDKDEDPSSQRPPFRILLGQINDGTAKVNAVAFTNDGNRCLVGGDDKMAIIYDTASGKALITIKRDGSVR